MIEMIKKDPNDEKDLIVHSTAVHWYEQRYSKEKKTKQNTKNSQPGIYSTAEN